MHEIFSTRPDQRGARPSAGAIGPALEQLALSGRLRELQREPMQGEFAPREPFPLGCYAHCADARSRPSKPSFARLLREKWGPQLERLRAPKLWAERPISPRSY